MACITSNPVGTADAILAPCVGAKVAAARAPASPPHIVPYGGSYGIGVMTRETIVAQDVLRLEGDLNPRGAIYARLRTEALGDVDAFCTHLTPDISDLTPPEGRTWGDVHAGQVKALASWIDAKSDGSRPILLLGDFNSGPPISATITSRFAEDYARLVARGFVNAYVTPKAECTFCDANPLNGGVGDEGSVIDHVLTKAFLGKIAVERVFVDPIELRVAGKVVRGAYSDHYGLMATLRGLAR